MYQQRNNVAYFSGKYNKFNCGGKKTEKIVSGDNWTMLDYLLPLNRTHSMNTAHVYTH